MIPRRAPALAAPLAKHRGRPDRNEVHAIGVIIVVRGMLVE